MVTAANLGPWHGQFEGHARVYMVLALVEAAGLVISPWLLGWIAILHHPGRLYASDLPVSPGWLAIRGTFVSGGAGGASCGAAGAGGSVKPIT